MLDKKDELVRFMKKHCVEYGDITLSSGKKSKYKIECDSLFENNEMRKILADMGSEKWLEIEGGRHYNVVGVITGGYLFGDLIAKRLGRKLIGVDPHRGRIYDSVPISLGCISEDVVTTGGNVIKTLEQTIQEEILVKDVLAIVDRQEGGEENLRKRGFRLHTILKREDLNIKKRYL